jgi:hypothetical protein
MVRIHGSDLIGAQGEESVQPASMSGARGVFRVWKSYDSALLGYPATARRLHQEVSYQ